MLYAVFTQPDVLPLREVFSAIKAVSNTLFAHSRSERSTSGLYDVFEELSTLCMEKISQKSAKEGKYASGGDVIGNWQEASASVTANIGQSLTRGIAMCYRADRGLIQYSRHGSHDRIRRPVAEPQRQHRRWHRSRGAVGLLGNADDVGVDA